MEGVKVTYHVRDELPGNAPAMFAAVDGRLDVIFSRGATVDEISDALGPMYGAMACSVMAMRPLRAVI